MNWYLNNPLAILYPDDLYLLSSSTNPFHFFTLVYYMVISHSRCIYLF
jgi:hypothetical protein